MVEGVSLIVCFTVPRVYSIYEFSATLYSYSRLDISVNSVT